MWEKPEIGWKGDGRGKMEKAPPPEAFQLILINSYVYMQMRGKRQKSRRETHGRCANDIGVPGAVGHLDIFDAILLFRSLAEDVSKTVGLEKIIADRGRRGVPVF